MTPSLIVIFLLICLRPAEKAQSALLAVSHLTPFEQAIQLVR